MGASVSFIRDFMAYWETKIYTVQEAKFQGHGGSVECELSMNSEACKVLRNPRVSPSVQQFPFLLALADQLLVGNPCNPYQPSLNTEAAHSLSLLNLLQGCALELVCDAWKVCLTFLSLSVLTCKNMIMKLMPLFQDYFEDGIR